MSSTIFYKFKSQKDMSRILFDGTGLTVFDLKREIIQENKLGDGTDFQLRVYNPDTNEEYEEDQTVIARSSSILAQRSPPVSKQGSSSSSAMGKTAKMGMLGNATRYVTGKPRVFQSKKPNTMSVGGSASGSTGGASGGSTGGSEEDRIANMFANQENQWEQTQQEMSGATPVFFKNQAGGAGAGMDDGPPPPGYMCYRCGSRDHWIKNCPTNSDPNFEGKRIRRTTGIPKKFLKSVEIDANSMTPEEMAQRKIMITDEGKFVVQIADEHSWEDYQRKQQKRLIDSNEAVWQKGYFKDLPDELKCSLTGGLLNNPVKTTKCCNKYFNKAQIEDYLLESDFVCPQCKTPDILLDSLQEDPTKAKEVDDFLKSEKAQKQKQKQKQQQDEDTHIDKKVKSNLTIAPPPFMPPFPMFPMPFMPMPQNQNQNQKP